MRYAMVLVLGCVFLAGCTSATSVIAHDYNFGTLNNVAIVEVAGDDQLTSGQIGNDFQMELMNKGYHVLDRMHVAKILDEQKFQASQLASGAGAAQVGTMLGADAVMTVTVQDDAGDINISGQMVDSKTGRVIFSGGGTGSAHRGAIAAGSALAGAAAGAAAGRHIAGHHHRFGGMILGGTVGGAAGGVIGYSLAPSDERIARSLVRKICASLPAVMGAQQVVQ
jgi:hypothetical protein